MHAIATASYWIDSATLPRFPKLDRNLEVDVVVVGAGITGITAAYLLKKSGRTVALIERAGCATIDTGHTTAHLTAVTDLRLQEMMDVFGSDTTKAVWDAGGAAIDQIVANIHAESIDCEFRWVPGYLHAPLQDGGQDHAAEFEREATAASDLGIHAEFMAHIPRLGLPGVKFPHQALFHPRKYLNGLLQRIPGNGSHVFEHTQVDDVAADPLAVVAGPFRVRCAYVVLATHNPISGRNSLLGATLFQSKLALYTTYAIGARVPSDLLPEASFWDTSDPYYYLRIDRHTDGDYAIFGGEDHKTGQETDTEASFQRLETRFRQIAPDAQIDHRWSGQVIQTNDGLPFIGETAKNQFVATGFAGNGMTFGTLSAMMATDSAAGRKNPWREIFDVHRTKVRGGTWDYIKENKDYPYYMLRDWLGGAEGDSVAEVARNEGRIISLHGKKVAAYRDARGQLTLCSPVCTHLKCIVGWNDAEQTWDCPCHGSRFKPTGEVISGPAEKALERLPDSLADRP